MVLKYTFEWLLFGYFTPYMKKGSTNNPRDMAPENLPNLRSGDDVKKWSSLFLFKIDQISAKVKKKNVFIPKPQVVIFGSLLLVYKIHLVLIFLAKVAVVLLSMVSVLLMRAFLQSQETMTTMTSSRRLWGIFCTLSILSLQLVYILINSQTSFWSSRIAMRMQSSLITGLLHYTMLSPKYNKKDNKVSPNAYNIVSEDISAITAFIFGIIDIFIVPITVLSGYLFLVRSVGSASLFGMSILMTVILIIFALQIQLSLLKRPYAERRDARLQRCHETLTSLRCIRMLGWADLSAQHVQTSRDDELAYRRTRMYLDTIGAVLSHAAYTFTQVTVISFYVLNAIREDSNFVFKASVVMPAIQVIRLIADPFTHFPFTVNDIIEGWVSSERYYTRILQTRPSELILQRENTRNPKASDKNQSSAIEESPLLSLSSSFSSLSSMETGMGDTQSSHHEPNVDTEIQSVKLIPNESVIYANEVLFIWDSPDAIAQNEKCLLKQRIFSSSATWKIHNSMEETSGDSSSTSRSTAQYLGVCFRERLTRTYHDLKFHSFMLAIKELHLKDNECGLLTGPSGSGKSSLLLALMGNMTQLVGHLSIRSKKQRKTSILSSHGRNPIGYTSSAPWIPKGTVESIILFGRPMDQKRYRRVLRACELEVDISTWAPEGDQRIISEGGFSLSGGQRARIALARALYGFPDHDASHPQPDYITDVFLLDDPFASLDPVVGSKIFFNLFGSNGILTSATTVLSIDENCLDHCLHYLSNFKKTQSSFHFKKYEIYDGFLHYNSSFSAFIPVPFNRPITPFIESTSHNQAVDALKACEELDDDKVLELPKVTESFVRNEESFFSGPINFHSYWWFMNRVGLLIVGIMAVLVICDTVVKLAPDLWLAYWTFCSSTIDEIRKRVTQRLPIHHLQPQPDFFFSSFQGLQHLVLPGSTINGSNIPTQSENNYSSLIAFSVISVLHVLFLFILYFFGAFGSLRAAAVIHKRIIYAVVRAPYCMYEFLPVGVLVNRFNTDIAIVDEGPLTTLSYFFRSIILLITTVLLLCVINPWCSAMVPIAGFLIYKFVYVLFRPASREIQRSKLAALSPLMAHLSDMELGRIVIRAFCEEDFFHEKSINLTSALIKTEFMEIGFTIWATTRLQLLSYPFTIVNSILPVFLQYLNISTPIQSISRRFLAFPKKNNLVASAGFIGLSVSMALGLHSVIGELIRSFTILEKKMCSVQRIQTLEDELGGESELVDRAIEIKPSPDTLEKALKLPFTKHETATSEQPDEANLPLKYSKKNSSQMVEELPLKKTGIEFRDLSVSYEIPKPVSHSALDVRGERLSTFHVPVLQSITASVKTGDCIGIVGRTGSGKTTLLLSLLNLVSIEHGMIFIDDVPLVRMSAKLIQKTIGVLPQFPPVLRGWSIRKFLDPENCFNSKEIYKALDTVGLRKLVNQLPEGLETILMSEAAAADSRSEILSDSELRMASIARLSLQRKTYRIVLIDEPPSEYVEKSNNIVSNIDSQSESSQKSVTDTSEHSTLKSDIADILMKLFPSSIILIVAHHATSLRRCNFLWILSRGRLKGIERVSSALSQYQLTELIMKHEGRS